MKKILKPLAQKIYSSPAFQRVRMKTGWRAPMNMRPFSPDETVSDLFPWRVDGKWETLYALPNMMSQFSPDVQETDIVTIIIYDHAGQEIIRQNIDFAPMEVRLIKIEDLLKGQTGHGTFAIFHDIRKHHIFKESGTYPMERCYYAFKWRDDDIWSYVHGNLKAVSKHPDKKTPDYVSGYTKEARFYRPQLLFDDCDRFELFYTNPSSKARSIELRLKDINQNIIETKAAVILPSGIHIFDIDNKDRSIAIVEGWGQIAMWRPLIMKYYQSHFDVFHS
jgi:hypothetical protein